MTPGADRQVDVVIVAFGSRALILPCISAVRSLPGLGHIVVVDHGSDGSGELAAELGAEVLHDPTNPGFGAGQNHGADRCSAPFILLLNPDALISDPQALRRALRCFGDPLVGAVQGAVMAGDGSLERSQGRALGPLHLLGRALAARRLLRFGVVRRVTLRLPILRDTAERSVAAPVEVDSLAATSLLVRRSAFKAVGGFDERYFLYGEDLDLCRRLRGAGYRLLALPEAFVRHEGGASSGSGHQRELHWWRGTLTYAGAWWGPAPRAVGWLAATVMWIRLSVRRPASARHGAVELLWAPWRDGRRIRRSRSAAA